jgi:hypothetical protein
LTVKYTISEGHYTRDSVGPTGLKNRVIDIFTESSCHLSTNNHVVTVIAKEGLPLPKKLIGTPTWDLQLHCRLKC